MTEPTDPPRDSPIDPSDPRWVEDILERARRRAEDARPTAAPNPRPVPPAMPTGAPASGRPSPVAAVPSNAVPSNTSADATPVGAAAPTRVLAADPASVARNPRPRPAGDPTASSASASSASAASDSGASVDAPPRTAGTIGGPAMSTPDAPSGLVDATTHEPLPTDDEPEDEPAGMDKRMRSWLEWGGVIVGALLVAFLIRAVAFQAFYIPSESMESTLEVKDRLLVNKLSYKLHDVHRGDIIVFEKPPGETSKINDLIKRVIALPGETIEQQGNDLYIDRGEGPQKLTEGYIKDPGDIGQTLTWVQGCANPSTETTKCTIPEGHVWVMGDNRGHSHDSRVFGPIDEDLIVGRAFVKVWPLNKIGFL